MTKPTEEFPPEIETVQAVQPKPPKPTKPLYERAIARKPLFGWNAKADVQRGREYLEDAARTDSEFLYDRDHVIRLREFGLSPHKTLALLAETFPIMKDRKVSDNVNNLVFQYFADAVGAPGQDASGDDKREQQSDGSWSVAWSKTKFRVLKHWAWITASAQFIHDDGLQMMTDKQFVRQFGYLDKERNVMLSIDRRNVPIRRFVAQVYVPKQPPIFVYEQQPPMPYSGRVVFNIWRDSMMRAKPGDHAWFLDHVERLFPGDKISQAHLIDFMAQVIQHPQVKINFALLVQSIEGAGKGALGHILRRIIGGRNVIEPTNDEFKDSFCHWQEGAQLAIVAEVMLDGSKDILERLKKPITEDTLRVHKKFGMPFTIPNHMNFFCMTNHKNALPIGKTDRRWLVLFSPWRPKPDDKAYYSALWASIADDGKMAAVADYLGKHKIGLNPKGHAPMTAAKLEMQERAQTDIAAQLMARFEMAVDPFDVDVLRRDDVLDWLQSEGGRKNARALGREVDQFLDDIEARQLRRYKDRRHVIPAYRLLAVRDHAAWDAKPPMDVAREYHARVSPTDSTAADDFDFG